MAKNGERLRVALFTPLPPARTGTADYAAGLLPALRQVADVEVFGKPARASVLERFHAVVYQIGNNPYHADIYRMALERPGVIVLHEPNVHDLVRGLTGHREKTYLEEVAYELYGVEWGKLPEKDRAAIRPQPQTFTMIRRLLARSQACIVHSRYAGGQVRGKGFRGPMAQIPHGAAIGTRDGVEYRRRLGIKPGQPLVGMFGYQRPDKQLCECLEVFRALVAHRPDARMIVVGEPHPEVPLAKMVGEMELEGMVRLLGMQPLEDFDGYLAACDVVLNLRWPTFGETSGTMMRAMGLGRAVVTSDSGAARELPDDVCARIPGGPYQNRILLETLKWLCSDPEAVAEMGRAARVWVSRTCTWEQVARQYEEFLRSVAFPAPAAAPGGTSDAADLERRLFEWVQPGPEPLAYLQEHVVRLVRTLQLIPPGREAERILEIGCYMQITPSLAHVLGYGEVRGCYLGAGGEDERTVTSSAGETFHCAIDLFDVETDEFPYPSHYFDTVVCGEVLEHLQYDPMHMMEEIYRILKPGGTLVLTTPNAVSLHAVAMTLVGSHPVTYNRYTRNSDVDRRHAREYTPGEIQRLLTDSGFLPVHLETGPYSSEQEYPQWMWEAAEREGLPRKLRGQCIYAVGRKTNTHRDRYPAWLYL